MRERRGREREKDEEREMCTFLPCIYNITLVRLFGSYANITRGRSRLFIPICNIKTPSFTQKGFLMIERLKQRTVFIILMKI